MTTSLDPRTGLVFHLKNIIKWWNVLKLSFKKPWLNTNDAVKVQGKVSWSKTLKVDMILYVISNRDPSKKNK